MTRFRLGGEMKAAVTIENEYNAGKTAIRIYVITERLAQERGLLTWREVILPPGVKKKPPVIVTPFPYLLFYKQCSYESKMLCASPFFQEVVFL
ncbi:MAG: hypothetical protein U5L09_05100 [Bacteroidales bacterium]|nr:hypothetical protein [Bacteroidales bacterium]